MANFHSNEVVIAASPEDMLRVLRVMDRNLQANLGEAKRRGVEEGINSLSAAADVMLPCLRDYYWYAFAPDPQGAGGALPKGDGYDDPLALSCAMAAGGASERGIADVYLEVEDDPALIRFSYRTKWLSNCADLESFLHSLPEGRYGVVMLDADEYDGYESVTVRRWLLGGSECVVESHQEAFTRKELWQDLMTVMESEGESLGLVAAAYFRAVLDWKEYDYPIEEEWEKEEREKEEREKEEEEWLRESGRWAYSLNWRDPQEEERLSAVRAVYALLKEMPLCVELTGSSYRGRAEHVEMLVPGSVVGLRSDWESEFFQPVGIEAFDCKGRTLGNLDSNPLEGFFLRNDDYLALAFLLPHLTAVVDQVEPLSIRSKRARHPRVVIRLEVEPLDIAQVVEEIGALVGLKRCDRGCVSRTEGGR